MAGTNHVTEEEINVLTLHIHEIMYEYEKCDISWKDAISGRKSVYINNTKYTIDDVYISTMTYEYMKNKADERAELTEKDIILFYKSDKDNYPWVLYVVEG